MAIHGPDVCRKGKGASWETVKHLFLLKIWKSKPIFIHHYSKYLTFFTIQFVLLTLFHCSHVASVVPCDNCLNHVTNWYAEFSVLCKNYALQFPQTIPPLLQRTCGMPDYWSSFGHLSCNLLLRTAVEKLLPFDCDIAHYRIYVCIGVDHTKREFIIMENWKLCSIYIHGCLYRW